MKKFRVLSLALVAAMCFSLLAGCGGGSSASPSPSASAPTASQPAETGSAGESGEITIALITNTTGDYAQYGIPVHNGAKLYIDQLNANGGINGKTIKVLEYDDKADGIETVNAFNLAMDNGITAVIGSVLTGATIALSDHRLRHRGRRDHDRPRGRKQRDPHQRVPLLLHRPLPGREDG